MAAPFIVIRTFTVRSGKLDEFKHFLREFFAFIEAHEPRLLALNAYLSEDGTEATFVHVHADAASMDAHETVAHEHTERARREFLESTTSIQVYGRPSATLGEKMKRLVDTGVPLSAKAEHLGGFTRLATAESSKSV